MISIAFKTRIASSSLKSTKMRFRFYVDVVMLMFVRMTMTAVAICESLMVIGNGRIGKIPKTGKTGHKIGEIYKMEGDIRVRERGQIGRQRITCRDSGHAS